jgi:serine/threonine protein kinase
MGYAPPEQYGNAQTTQRSDIYSLGVTLHQMVSGHKPSLTPFLLPPLHSVLPGAPDDLAALLAQMLDMDEYKRPASMVQVKQRLQSIASTASTSPTPPPPPPPRVSLTPPPPPPPQFEQTVYAFSPNPPTPIPQTQFAPPLQQVGTLTPPPVDQVSRPGRKPLLIVLAVVLLLIICGGIVFAIINNSNTTAHNNAVATQQAQTNDGATATAAANATATAIAAATATAVANATATGVANPDPYQQGTTLALLDPLSQQSQWAPQSSSNGGQCQFTSNAYQISQTQLSFFEICPSSQSYSNFVFEVHMTITQGDCGGITVRNNSSNTNLYLFDVCQDGNYYFVKYVSNSGGQATTLKSGTAAAINTGANQSNVLAIVANGSTFQLYVNSQLIDSASDGAYSQGTIGLVADPRSNNQTIVTYQNARLWTF